MLNNKEITKSCIFYFSTTALRCKWPSTGSTDVERSLLKGDNLPANYQLIYRAPLEKYVTWAKNVSTLTVSLISLIAGYNLATTSMNFSNVVKKIDVGVLASTETDIYFFAVGFVLINMVIRIFVFKYPLRIYKSGNKYVLDKLLFYINCIILLQICCRLWLTMACWHSQALFSARRNKRV